MQTNTPFVLARQMLRNEIDLSAERSRAALQPMEGPRIRQ